MNEIFTYLLQSGIILILLFGVYWLFLRNDTFFSFSRFFLMVSAIFSFALPLFKITLPFREINSGFVFLLESVEITPNQLSDSIKENFHLLQLLNVIYLIGVGLLLTLFFYKLTQIGMLIIRFGITKRDGLNFVISNSNFTPFSFFNIIFLNSDILNNRDFEKIITHEKIHIQQKHSFDLIILELLTIIQWFNPFIWLYKSTIRNIHEFLADKGVLHEGHSRSDYQELLLSQTFGVQLNSISNNFNPVRKAWPVGQSLIKRRFIMMSKFKTNKSTMFKMVFILPLAVILAVAISLSINEKVIAHEIADENQIETSKTLSFPQEDKVYEVVEQMPKYPGGDKARTKFIVDNTKYPEKARKEGITGTVIVSFIVEKNGKITNVELEKGIGGGCDEEAMRVVNLMPQWEPGMNKGKPVRVQFKMPFSFMLDTNKTKKEEPNKKTKSSPPLPYK